MSLYNLIYGENAQADILLAMLGLTRADVPRYRDCYWTGDQIAIHTRTGGGNREYYESLESCQANYPEYFKSEDDHPSGPWNSDLRKHETYISDEDADYDRTYATFLFSVPVAFEPLIPELKAADATPAQRWESFIARLKDLNQKDDPQVQRAIKAFEPIFKAIQLTAEKPAGGKDE